LRTSEKFCRAVLAVSFVAIKSTPEHLCTIGIISYFVQFVDLAELA
jgi:hypothetical protein